MSKSINDMSGRSQSKARRKSKLSGGKAGIAKATRAPRKKSEPVIPVSNSSASVAAMPVKPEFVSVSTKRQPLSQQPIVVAEGRAMAKQKRKQMIRGKTGLSKTNTQGSLKTRKKPDEMVELRSTSKNTSASFTARNVSPTAAKLQVKSEATNGRNMSKARRKALVKGKTGQASFSGQSSSIAKMTNPDASVRDVARAVRAERCSKGKTGCSTPAKSSRRQRRKNRNDAPEKVSLSETLSGSVVSGVHVGQGQLTGAEKGACKNVSGTEYLGMEEFTTHCSTVPESSPSKVSFTQTSKGRTVSGTEVGQAQSVTGDRAGLCSSITGTEYLPADQSSLFCGAEQESVKPSSGSMIPPLMKRPSRAPKSAAVSAKVAISTTMAGNMTTGTQVGRGLSVTGDERGFCQAVTGIGYQGKEDVSAVCETNSSVSPPEKVLVSGTVGGQVVTGDRSGSVSGMTGAEVGSCQPVSGTAYVGTEFASDNCSAEAQASIVQRSKQAAIQSSKPMTGVRPGVMGLTGAQKGACELVSGTRYQSASEMSQVCESSGAATLGDSDYPVVIGQATAATLAGDVTTSSTSSSAITGDGWEKGNKVTGTDGAWAAKRNPSIRGVQGQSPMSAANFRPHSMPDVPQSPITGSSGNTVEGSKVTLSGGARA